MTEKIIKVKVNAGSKTEKIEEISPDIYKVRVAQPPEKGKANQRVLELVAEYFNVPISRVCLISGNTYKEKVISVTL